VHGSARSSSTVAGEEGHGEPLGAAGALPLVASPPPPPTLPLTLLQPPAPRAGAPHREPAVAGAVSVDDNFTRVSSPRHHPAHSGCTPPPVSVDDNFTHVSNPQQPPTPPPFCFTPPLATNRTVHPNAAALDAQPA
jgi:hypothetical protein